MDLTKPWRDYTLRLYQSVQVPILIVYEPIVMPTKAARAATAEGTGDVVDRLFQAFKCGGYDAASLAEISSATGLGKSSLYHHFPGGKEQMAEAVLDRVATNLEAGLLAPLAAAGTLAERIERMLTTVNALYCGGVQPCVVGLFAVGSMGDAFQPRLGQIFSAWINGLAKALEEAGVPAADALLQAEAALARIQGALVLARAVGDTGPFQRTLAALKAELVQP